MRIELSAEQLILRAAARQERAIALVARGNTSAAMASAMGARRDLRRAWLGASHAERSAWPANVRRAVAAAMSPSPQEEE